MANKKDKGEVREVREVPKVLELRSLKSTELPLTQFGNSSVEKLRELSQEAIQGFRNYERQGCGFGISTLLRRGTINNKGAVAFVVVGVLRPGKMVEQAGWRSDTENIGGVAMKDLEVGEKRSEDGEGQELETGAKILSRCRGYSDDADNLYDNRNGFAGVGLFVMASYIADKPFSFWDNGHD